MIPRAWGVVLVLLLTAAGCSPLVREADFRGARDQVTDATLIGPFDGQIVDEATAEPIGGAMVVGVWSYDEGSGFIGPRGSETAMVRTDQAGRYRIPEAPRETRGRNLRLVDFTLVIYKRGYVGYRSDVTFEGHPRHDFTLRHNRVRLRKWRESDSHAEHLLFLAGPPVVAQLSKWERDAANLDLYRDLAGESSVAPPVTPGPTGVLEVLDATAMLTPEDVRRRTGYTDAFDVKELGDLARTHFYHGVHLQATGREEQWDVSLRVWRDPPGGLGPVQETLEATLPGVQPTGEITDETWVFDGEDVRAVAFMQRDAEVGVLLTCGAMQCIDIETAIILAKHVHDSLDQLRSVEADAAGSTSVTGESPAR